MKSKSKTVKYPSESALENQRLESLLPAFITRAAFEAPPLPKTLEFFRSEEFIWNNPYRSSKKTFRYFHQGARDNAPRLQEMRRLELTDRHNAEQHRIQCVRDLRSQDIQRIRLRRRRRELLDSRCHGQDPQEQPVPSSSPCRPPARPQESQTDREIFNLIRSETLKNRELQCGRLKRRHEQNAQLMTKAGLKSSCNWTAMRFHSSEGDDRARH